MATSGQYEKQKEKWIQPHNSTEKNVEIKATFRLAAKNKKWNKMAK